MEKLDRLMLHRVCLEVFAIQSLRCQHTIAVALRDGTGNGDGFDPIGAFDGGPFVRYTELGTIGRFSLLRPPSMLLGARKL